MAAPAGGANREGVRGCAELPEEIEQLANAYADFSVYVVEVCRTCSWNHLVLSFALSMLSYHGVEDPLRKAAWSRRGTARCSACR